MLLKTPTSTSTQPYLSSTEAASGTVLTNITNTNSKSTPRQYLSVL